MSGKIDVRYETMHEIGRLLHARSSELSALRSLGPAPDAGGSTAEVDHLLRQVEHIAASLARRVGSVAAGVDDSRDCYTDADDVVRERMNDLGRAGDR